MNTTTHTQTHTHTYTHTQAHTHIHIYTHSYTHRHTHTLTHTHTRKSLVFLHNFIIYKYCYDSFCSDQLKVRKYDCIYTHYKKAVSWYTVIAKVDIF